MTFLISYDAETERLTNNCNHCHLILEGQSEVQYSVRYVLGGSEKGIDAKYIQPSDLFIPSKPRARAGRIFYQGIFLHCFLHLSRIWTLDFDCDAM